MYPRKGVQKGIQNKFDFVFCNTVTLWKNADQKEKLLNSERVQVVRAKKAEKATAQLKEVIELDAQRER